MAKTIVLSFKLNGAEQSVKNISELKSAISELENNLNNAKFGSAGFERQKAQLDELKDKYSEMSKTATQSAAESAEKFQKAGDDFEKFSKGMVDAFTGVAIAIGASDEDTEAFMRTFVQFQGIATGVKGAIEGVLVVTKNWSAIQKVLNAVLFANPIGLIVLGVAALAGGIYLLIKNIDAVIEVFSDWKNIVLALLGPLGWILNYLNEADKAENNLESTREKASKKEATRHQKRLGEIKEKRRLEKEAFENGQKQFDLQIARAEAEGKSSKALQLEKLNAIITERKAVLQSNLDIIESTKQRYAFEAQLRGKTLEEFLGSIGIQYETVETQLTESTQALRDSIYSAETDLIAFKNSDATKVEAEFTFPEPEEINNEAVKAWTSFLDIWNKGKLPIKIDEEDIMPDEEIILEAEAEVYSKKQQQLKDFYDQGKITADEYYQYLGASEETLNQKVFQLRAENASKSAGIAQQYADSANSLAQGVFAISNSFGRQDEAAKEKRAKRQFQINKALALSSAVIDGYKAITASLAASPLVIGVAPNPVGIANLVATAAATAGNIAKIASSQYKSSASGGGGAGGPASTGSSNIGAGGFGDVSSPTLNTQTLFSSGGGQTQTITPFGNKSAEAPIVKAIVVESDITNMQKNIFNIERRASLGIAG